MQFAGGNLPNDLSLTRHADDDRAERHHQCDGKHDLSVELQFGAGHMPDDLRAAIAVPVAMHSLTSGADYF